MTGADGTALLFPGQGAQRAGMGEVWRDCASWELIGTLSEHTGADVEELLLKADDETLRRTDLAQIAVFSTAVLALYEARAAGLHGTAYAGHSLGEYVALHAAGALTLPAAAALVGERGRAMRQAAAEEPGSMAVLVGADAAAVDLLVASAHADGHRMWVANVNCPGQIVVAGTHEGIAHVDGAAGDHGAKVIRVPVGGAFHTPLMAGAGERLSRALRSVRFAPRHEPLVANADARVHTGADVDWRDLAVRQLTGPVLWERSVEVLHDELGCRRFVTLGPSGVLAGMVRRIRPEAAVTTLDTAERAAARVS
ncbi:ACP S-malonyltransferase [Streptomyces sp. NPDC052042]|uniref:ACP S-malonyltransferase n=1 Tax=Streptomyces sp. NPDC052042 TaxID=3365683 RepID=UPI0037CD51B3